MGDWVVLMFIFVVHKEHDTTVFNYYNRYVYIYLYYINLPYIIILARESLLIYYKLKDINIE